MKKCPVNDVEHNKNTDKEAVIYDGANEMTPREGFMVACPSCLLFTGWHQTEEEAIAAWDDMAKIEKKAEDFRDR